jgi:signal transduction histidine kinase
VRHLGELLGAITVEMPANDPINPSKERVIRDLAAEAGLVLRNVKLIEDLRASRQRLAAAQDEERRKIERNIHDGAQQQLVALSVKLRLADSLVDRDASKAHEMLRQLQAETTEALENLRDLARGIYPPLLADQGLAAALEAQARKSPVPTTIEPDGVGRYPPEVEATVYFCALEALQNVAKYAEASSVTVRLRAEDGNLTFEVADDGRGFDPGSTGYGTGLQGIADRLAALGGEIDVTSAPGRGTTLAGRLPIEDVP